MLRNGPFPKIGAKCKIRQALSQAPLYFVGFPNENEHMPVDQCLTCILLPRRGRLQCCQFVLYLQTDLKRP